MANQNGVFRPRYKFGPDCGNVSRPVMVKSNAMLLATLIVNCGMKQRRLSDAEKIQLCQLWETENYTYVQLAEQFGISSVAIGGLLRRRGYKAKPQSDLQRKYAVDESFFDVIDTQEKAYFLGILYADGYNNAERNTASLSLKESDKEILVKLGNLIQPTKPLQYVVMKAKITHNQYRLSIASKRISTKLTEHGCMQAKTFLITFPDWLENGLVNHFVRGYFDGDGYVGRSALGKNSLSIVGTESICSSIRSIFNSLGLNVLTETRHPERNHCIRNIKVSGRKQLLTLYEWLYKDATLFLARKRTSFEYTISTTPKPKKAACLLCEKCAVAMGYCRNHYYSQNGGKEKRHQRYLTLQK